VKIKAAATFEPLGTQGTLVEMGYVVEEKVKLEVAVVECDEWAMGAVEEGRHAMGEVGWFC